MAPAFAGAILFAAGPFCRRPAQCDKFGTRTMNWMEWVADFAFLLMPPVSCVWAWWLWKRQSQVKLIPLWRRVCTAIGLTAFTLSIALGAFALFYWRHYPGEGPGPPEPTQLTTLLGFTLAVFGIPLAVLAKSWNRVALILCSLGLLGFYFGMFVAP
ncbi:MAG TPA: hypothetical protein VED66_09630 [Candidatus Sulfotelmatobacter sp.]|nr:hypothetical protein [Candidatus Sulfotelmatobacter sp.]